MVAAVIVGSSFSQGDAGFVLQPVAVGTEVGEVILHQAQLPGGAEGFLLFRHGTPHRYLPHQIPYRAHAAALKAIGCDRLLVTSSVGVLSPDVPLFTPLVVDDLLMLDNRLPDGTACTMFRTPSAEQGHLVLGDGLFSRGLGEQLDGLAGVALPRVVFAYVGGPRTKTAAENRWLAASGAQVNSMTLGPEVVLANELGIATAGLCVGHKYSLPRTEQAAAPALSAAEVSASLVQARLGFAGLIAGFLAQTRAVANGNHLYRFADAP